MRNILTLTCLALMLVACSGSGFDMDELKKFPRYEAVYTEAFGTRSMYIDNKWFLKLARKPDGWYLVKLDMESKEQGTFLFWSAAENKYLPFPKELSRPGSPTTRPNFNEAGMFRVIPFYGYKNWYEDVITHLEGAELSDTLTEALARAYDAKGSEKGGLTYGTDGKTIKQFSDEQETSYLTYMDKALETYQALYKKNPAYNTVVGNAHNKYSNECMYVYSSLLYFGHADKAGKYLRDGLYTPFIIDFAKNILSSCDQNAVLVTYGDNDYFPLLYVQDKLGFRKDVAVINNSLMMVVNYIEKFVNRYQLKHQLTLQTYTRNELEVVLISKEEDTVNMGKMFSDFSAGRLSEYAVPYEGEQRYLQLKGNILHFEDATGKDFCIQLPQSYAYKNDLFLWDLLFSNGNARPVNLTAVGSWQPYMPALREKGMIYSFTYASPDPTQTRALLDTAAIDDLLTKKYQYNWTGKNPDVAEKVAAGNYLFQFYNLGMIYMNAGKKAEAIRVVKKALEFFPQKTLPGHYTYCVLANVLQECGEEDTAVQIDLQYLDDLEVELKTAKSEEMENLMRRLQSLLMMAGNGSAKWEPVKKKASALLDKYMKAELDQYHSRDSNAGFAF